MRTTGSLRPHDQFWIVIWGTLRRNARVRGVARILPPELNVGWSRQRNTPRAPAKGTSLRKFAAFLTFISTYFEYYSMKILFKQGWLVLSTYCIITSWPLKPFLHGLAIYKPFLLRSKQVKIYLWYMNCICYKKKMYLTFPLTLPSKTCNFVYWPCAADREAYWHTIWGKSR